MESLPNEVLTMILSYLSTNSLLQFLKVFENYQHFLNERRVIQYFNLNKMFELSSIDVCRFICTKTAYKYIKILNIDGLYWITIQDIRMLISKLTDLEELYATDTKLGVRSDDIALYGKLKKLSTSLEANQLEHGYSGNSNFYFNYLHKLNSLCLKLNLKRDNFEQMYYFCAGPRQLMELWIYDNDVQHGVNYERIVANLPNLNKLVIKSKRPIQVIDLTCWGFIKTFQNTAFEFASEAVFTKGSGKNMEEHDNILNFESQVEEAWDIMKNLHCDMPWGPSDVKLKKLAVTVEDNQFYHSTVTASQQLKNLKSLCLKFTQKKEECFGIYLFFREMKQLEELWVYDEYESNYRIDYSRLVIALKRLNKFVIKSKVALPYYDFKCDGLLSTFACKRCDSATELIFERVIRKSEESKRSIFDPRESDLERCWELFENLHKDLPCGAKESKQIYMKKAIKEIYFEDLNFCHAVILCNTKYISAALQILSAKNSTKLKRLSFRSCLFQDTHKQTRDEKTSGFKKPRRGVQINTDTHPFRSVADNIKCLTELEIFICPGCSGEAVLSAYPLIQIFENLQKLTLDVPILMDGLFFKEVFTKCQCLESLNLNCVGQNGKFLLNLCQNLKYARNLRDFRLEHKDIVIDKLFDGLNGMEHKRLLRVFLKCDNLQYTCETSKLNSLFNFMTNNPQLVFFLLIVSKNTAKENSNIQKILNNSKKGNPAKVFYVKNDVSAFMGVFPIPAAHHDIIFNYTNVSVIRIDEF